MNVTWVCSDCPRMKCVFSGPARPEPIACPYEVGCFMYDGGKGWVKKTKKKKKVKKNAKK